MQIGSAAPRCPASRRVMPGAPGGGLIEPGPPPSKHRHPTSPQPGSERSASRYFSRSSSTNDPALRAECTGEVAGRRERLEGKQPPQRTYGTALRWFTISGNLPQLVSWVRNEPSPGIAVLKAGTIEIGGGARPHCPKPVKYRRCPQCPEPGRYTGQVCLVIPSDQLRRPCRVVWRKMGRIGIRFD